MKATNESVARIEGIRIMREHNGKTFAVIGKAFGITPQLAQHIYAADARRIEWGVRPAKLANGRITPSSVWAVIQQLRRIGL